VYVGDGTAQPGAQSERTRQAVVLTDFQFDSQDLERLSQAVGAHNLIMARDRAAFLAQLSQHPETEVLCTFQPPADLAALAPHVRWVQLPSAGADGAARAGLVRPNSGVVVTTASGIHAIPIAEFALSCMLMFVRHWPALVALQRDHTWPGRDEWQHLQGRELFGATLGIVGLGHIGRRVATLARAVGMQTLGIRRSAPGAAGDPDVDVIYPLEGLQEMLMAADFVLIAVPRTPDTHHMFGERQLQAMRRTAYLINVARGDAVDEAALIDALSRGQIGGAALDVTEHEPLDARSPLWSFPNVIISPHVSGSTDRYSARFTNLFLENLARYRSGQPLLNVVDPARGY
jgi:phosphoglycerate dehydrogenase-like enzyme